MILSPHRFPAHRAFTLLELMTAVVIMAILISLLFPAFGKLRGRAQTVACISNLKSLHVAADVYVQQNGLWPQINTVANAGKTDEEKAALWIAALGVDRRTWICPTQQELLGNPDYTAVANVRLDYIPMTFDDKRASPFQWPTQPWFVERGDVHGNGNLIIFTDGSIKSLKEVMPAK